MENLNAMLGSTSQFDPSDFVSVSNQQFAIPDGWKQKKGPEGKISQHYQQAKRAGLWHLHECFQATTEPTVGIEIELYLVEAWSRALAPCFDAIYKLLPEWTQRLVKKEAFQFQIEVATSVHRSVESAGKQLEQCLTAITGAADQLGVELLWQAGIQDFEVDFEHLHDSERTQSTLQRHPEKISLLHHNGMHVHVGVARDRAIEICDRMTAINDQIIGMAANSPFVDNGIVVCESQRCQRWLNAFPTLPKRYYRNWAGFYEAMMRFNHDGIVLEPKDNYAWVRPTAYGTCEIRTADLPKDLSNVLDVAEFIHDEVQQTSARGNQSLPSIEKVRIRCQQAARLGNAYRSGSTTKHGVTHCASLTNLNNTTQNAN